MVFLWNRFGDLVIWVYPKFMHFLGQIEYLPEIRWFRGCFGYKKWLEVMVPLPFSSCPMPRSMKRFRVSEELSMKRLLRIWIFVVVPIFPVFVVAQPSCGESWQWDNPTPPLNDFRRIASNGSLLVAVGLTGIIMTSSDGSTWQRQDSGTTSWLWDVTWNGSIFLAVGSGRALSSPNGLDWTISVTNPVSLRGVTWTGSLFVGVGQGGGITTSSDGENWVVQTSGTTDLLSAVTWTGSLLVAVGANGSILSSPDGIVWSPQNSPDTSFMWGVRYLPGLIIAMGNSGALWTSTDGTSWTAQTTGTFSALYDASWNGSTFVVVGSSSGATILTSSNGVDWQSETSGSGQGMYGIAWTGTDFVAVGNNESIIKSIDGVQWSLEEIHYDFWGITLNQSSFYTAGTNGVVAKSDDGSSWNIFSTPVSTHLYRIRSLNNRLVAVGTQGTLISSLDNGASWQEGTGISGATWDVGFDGSTYYTVGVGIYSSTDLLNWDYISPGLFFGIAFNESLLVAVGSNGGIFTSPDGILWEPQVSNTTESLRAIEWNGTHFVAVGGNGIIVTSADGLSWDHATSPTNQTLMDIASRDNYCVAVGSGGTIITSDNGEVWSDKSWPSYVGIYRVAIGPDQVLACGEAEMILSSTCLPVYTTLPEGFVTWGGNIAYFCSSLNPNVTDFVNYVNGDICD